MTDSCMVRLQASLRGTPNDRVPIIPMIGGWAAANFSDVPLSKLAYDPKRIANAQVRAMEAVGHDAFFAYADPFTYQRPSDARFVSPKRARLSTHCPTPLLPVKI